MSKKIVKITESELKKIIAESVVKILNEGQGWDTLKYVHKGIKNGEYDDVTYPELKDRIKDVKPEMDNFLKTGDQDSEGRLVPRNYYDPEDPTFGEVSPYGSEGKMNKPIDKSTWGRIGREAGMRTAMGYLKGKSAVNSLRNKFGKK